MNWLALLSVFVIFGLLHCMNKKGVSFLVRVLTATFLGGVIGLIFAGHTEYVQPIGRIYANLLRAVVTPLLLFSVIKTVVSLNDLESLSSIGGRTMAALSVHNVLGTIGSIVFSLLFNIGSGANVTIPTDAEIAEVPDRKSVV